MIVDRMRGGRGTCALLGVVAMLATVAGCGPGRDYQAPQVPVPERFAESATTSALSDEQMRAAWQRFHDPVIAPALTCAEQSWSVREALARLREARALRRAAGADYLPQVHTSAGAHRSRTTENGVNPAGGRTETTYVAGVDLSWEIDLFGGITRSREASASYMESQQASVQAVRLAWQADVVAAIAECRSSQALADCARQIADAATRAARIMRARGGAGAVAQSVVEQAQIQAVGAAAAVAPTQAEARAARYRLSLLTNVPLATVDGWFAAAAPVERAPTPLPAGLPSDVMRRRPDIRKAERDIAYAVARIGVIESELFPRLALTGAAGLESIELDSLIESSSRFWSIGPSLRWTIFTSGRVHAQADAAEARADAALIAYERVVRTALSEVETALLRVRAGEESLRFAEAGALAAQRRLSWLALRANAGSGDALEHAEGERLSAEMSAARVRAFNALIQAQVTLVRALGGG